MIPWETSVIYESGVLTREDGNFAAGTGFAGVLVGEAAVKHPEFPGILVECFNRIEENMCAQRFWTRLYGKFSTGRPFVKICGITRKEDFDKITGLGADMAGFILAESHRKTDRAFIETCRNNEILKVGVVVLKPGENLPDEISNMLEDGILDAVQFHGSETPETCGRISRLQGVPDQK